MPTHKTRAQERIDALETPSVTQLMNQAAELELERDTAINEAADNLAGMQRIAADFQNYKRRTELEREQSAGLANESLLRKVLAIADDFDRAIEAMPEALAGDGWVQGMAAIDRKLRMLLESEGVTPIEALGRPFDPREHEALSNIETDRRARRDDRRRDPAWLSGPGSDPPAVARRRRQESPRGHPSPGCCRRPDRPHRGPSSPVRPRSGT